MFERIVGVLDRLDAGGPGGASAVVTPAGSGLSYRVLVPAYLGDELAARVGQVVTLHLRHDLEGHGQGTSFVPRLIGFRDEEDRAFFELLTGVKGLGVRRTLRALAAEPQRVAGWVRDQDLKALTTLPEIGKKMAESIVAELKDKVGRFLPASSVQVEGKARGPAPRGSPATAQAVAALVTLGESRPDAERLVEDTLRDEPGLSTPEAILEAAYRRRGA